MKSIRSKLWKKADLPFTGTDLIPQEVALLVAALRADLPDEKWYSDVHLAEAQKALQVDRGFLYRPAGIGALQLSEGGQSHLVDILGEPFVENLKILHPHLGVFIDHVYIGHDPYHNSQATHYMMRDFLRHSTSGESLLGIIDQAMCQAGEEEGGKRPWNTLAELNELGYHVNKKTDARVNWRYLWRETRDSSLGMHREWMGKR
jgi:hypothetical protein